MKIAIINTNDLKYSETDMLHSNFSLQMIKDVLSEYIVLKEVSNEDEMMENIIVEIVGNDNTYLIHTATTKNVDNDLYLICHIFPSKEIYEELKLKSEKFNGIASYLSDVGLRIYRKAVIFKLDTSISPNKLKSITMDEITDIFISKFIHKGVILNINGSINEFKFIFNPIDWITPTEISKYKYYEIEILGKIFMLFIDITSTVINETASKIYMQSIKGRVIIGMRSQHTDMNDTDVRYEDIDIDTFKMVIQLCNDPNQARNFINNEDIDSEMSERRSYNNFHKILKNRCLVQK